MSYENKSEIDELLNAYIDDELSDRQRTEVKRLIGNDPAIAEELARMQQQKRLLRSLPVETAPEGMLTDIKTALERDFILGETVEQTQRAAGEIGLFYRRILTAAAMVIIPVGILCIVVFSIISPPDTDKDTITKDDIGDEKSAIKEDKKDILAIAPVQDKKPLVFEPFYTMLQLKTKQPIEMNSFLDKSIYTNNLLDYVLTPVHYEQSTSYSLICDQDGIFDLLKDLGQVWNKCESASLTLYGNNINSNVTVDHVTFEQVMSILQKELSFGRFEYAAGCAQYNYMIGNIPEIDTYALSDADINDYFPSSPVRPVLTSDDIPKRRTKPQPGPKSHLVLVITGL